MKIYGITLLLALGLCSCASPTAAQSPASPEAIQIAGLRKELKRQRKSLDSVGKDLQSSRATMAQLQQVVQTQEIELSRHQRELKRLWIGGAAGLAVLLVLLLIVAMRRPSTETPGGELQLRLAALDRKLRDLGPRA